MTFQEIMPFLESGHKIRLSTWSEDLFYQVDKQKTEFITNRHFDGHFFLSYEIFRDDWEVIGYKIAEHDYNLTEVMIEHMGKIRKEFIKKKQMEEIDWNLVMKIAKL